MRPLAGRQCGPCTACCQFMPIKTETLEKPTNVLCPHCTEGVGCTVYDLRPTTCAEWQCGWKTMRQVPDDWRPRESGLVFRIEDVLDDEITITVLEVRPHLSTATLAKLIAAWHEAGIDLYLQTVGPPGAYPSRSHLNPRIAGAVAADDPDRLREALLAALDHLRADHVWQPDGITPATTILGR